MKRLLDVLLVLASLPLTLPLAALVASLVLAGGSGSVVHSQPRIGRGGQPFRMHKFRTLDARREAGASVAPAGDPRITRPGRFLRKWRLDELPQLYDVLRGAMSLVGPRPERPEHLHSVPVEVQREVYAGRPGLTGPAALAFLAEDEYLAQVADPVDVYCRVLLPEKLRLEREYLAHRSNAADLRLIASTLASVWSAAAHRRSRRRIERLAAAAGTRGAATEPAS